MESFDCLEELIRLECSVSDRCDMDVTCMWPWRRTIYPCCNGIEGGGGCRIELSRFELTTMSKERIQQIDP